ncbi:MAG: YHYH protein [Ferruginibacter sp.]
MKLRNLFLIFALLIIASSCNKSSSSTGGGSTAPTTAAIAALNCAGVSFNAVATAGVAYSATATVPYSGGNAASYIAGVAITSTGVTGLTATLQAGTLANGTGNLSFTVTGTPSAAGTAVFAVSFGGQSCSSSLTVNAAGASTPIITALACGSGSFSATATAGTAYTGTGTIPYSGGNGLAYTTGAAIASTGVTGLTATLIAGTLANGTGNLSYAVTGTPSAAGTATFAISFGGQSCSIGLTVNSTGGGPTLPAVYNKIYGATSITFDGTWVTIKYNALPDHKSAYYATTNPLYENFSGTTFGGGAFAKNPNTISTQNITLTIPVNPVAAATHATTPMGVMGVALNGVPFFNQYAAGGSPLTNEINGFDQWWGHPQQTGMYHYHVEPLYLTTVKATKSALMGFLLDGFPVYGPEESNGSAPAGLDVYHGHTHVTADYPAGIYHYHISTASPYINGNGFYGTPGTVTQ